MRSRSNRSRAFTAALMLVLLVAGAPAGQSAQPPDAGPLEAESGRPPDTRTINEALERVKADPNLATEQKIRMLQWRRGPPPTVPDWLRWLLNLFAWLAQSARALVWVAAVVGAALLAVYLSRTLRARAGARGARGLVAPTHVQDLDIRPESLPDDIGAAARALWDRGERRAALALLYRGLLSRLAHVHAVPIRDSTTEGTCLVLAATHLTEDRHEYVARLVRLWQQSVYGGHDADATAVYALCTGFRPALDPVPPMPGDGLPRRS